MTKVDAGTLRPTEVPVRCTQSKVTVRFQPIGNAFEASLATLIVPDDRSYELVAGWQDGGPTLPVTLVRDSTGPVLTATGLGRDGGDPDPVDSAAWKKDEKALVRVTVDDPAVTVAATNFSAPWNTVTASTTPARCGCDAGNCFCFEVGLAATVVNGVRAAQNFNVGPVSDSLGNVSNVAPGTFQVTRFKWQRQIGSSTTATPLPVAVSQTGLVIAGTVEAGPLRLHAFSQDGVAQWSAVDAGTVTAGPVVSASDAWVGTLEARARLQPLQLSTGAQGTYECDQANSASYDGDLALATVTVGLGSGERPIGVRGGQVRVGDGSCGFSSLTGFTPPARVVVQEGGSLSAFVAGGGATLWKAQLDGTQSWTTQGSAAIVVAPARGLALDGTHLAGAGGVANGGVFSTTASAPLTGTTTFDDYAPVGAPAAGPVSVGDGFVLYGDVSGRLVKVSYSAGVMGTSEVATTVVVGSSTQETNPLIGASGHVYSLAANGTLTVSATSSLAEQWRADSYFPVSGSKIGQPALDVLRTAGAKDCRGLGVLYVASANVGVASLTALLVDSPGLETTAPWPKYQRDNSNAGNFSRPLTPWVCP